jgi:hypothetical protein
VTRTRRPALLPVALLASIALAACGGDENAATSGEETIEVQQQPEAAANPSASDFPSPQGRTLEELAKLARPGPELAPATSHYVAGENRLAFGLIGNGGEFLYGPAVVYVGPSPAAKAQGPFLAPADSLVTEPAFRSQQAALEGDSVASIYGAQVPLAKPGPYSVLVLTDINGELFGATSQIEVQRSDPIPAAGDEAPDVTTDTVASAGGRIDEIETREPPDDMHETDFADVVGERPVALLFATPQLCQSRVCGPVTDIALQLKRDYGDEVEFIHQEVYVENDPAKGLREPLARFNLRTEPWLFTFDDEGRVAARLEGSFGLEQFEAAVKAALG